MEKNYQDYLAWTYFGKDAFDNDEFARLKNTLEGVRQFIDVGASHGIYTYHANKILKNANIYAIEADPERFSILKKNVDKWSTQSTNTIHCINAAASDEEDRQSNTIEFFTTGTQISGGLFSVNERSDEYKPIKIPVICLNDIYQEGLNTFIKIDVEGAELRVLKGASKYIESGNARFFTEISWWGDRDRGTTSLDFLKFCLRSSLRADRRLRSDYLITPEPSRFLRVVSIIRCLFPLLPRFIYNTFVPKWIRTWRERRLNKIKLSKYINSD